jgi:predicted nuclease of restriction endonuclease-like RecB superfamily
MFSNKYRARRTSLDGYSFQSKLEADCYLFLKNQEDVEILQTQIQVHLTRAKILYKPDFKIQYKSTKEIVYVEAKGFQTASWRIKRRLWMFYGPAPLLIYQARGTRLILTETIIPKTQGD